MVLLSKVYSVVKSVKMTQICVITTESNCYMSQNDSLTHSAPTLGNRWCTECPLAKRNLELDLDRRESLIVYDIRKSTEKLLIQCRSVLTWLSVQQTQRNTLSCKLAFTASEHQLPSEKLELIDKGFVMSVSNRFDRSLL